jgi:hypothetical protein
MHKHLSDEDLIDRLYEVGQENSSLETCEFCRQRWESVLARRREILDAVPQLPETWLAEQRRRIHQRIERPEPLHWGFRPAAVAATLGVMVLGLMLSSPSPERQPTRAANDSQFFTEVYSLVENLEPRAATPIYGLFEEQP